MATKTTKEKKSAEKKPKAKASTKKAAPKKESSTKDTFAVIETGSKQYRVKKGDRITVEKLDAEIGDTVEIEKVLLIDDGKKTDIGTPYLKGKKVSAEVVDAGRKKKINVIRFRAKSRHFKKKGHRQPYTMLKITKI